MPADIYSCSVLTYNHFRNFKIHFIKGQYNYGQIMVLTVISLMDKFEETSLFQVLGEPEKLFSRGRMPLTRPDSVFPPCSWPCSDGGLGMCEALGSLPSSLSLCVYVYVYIHNEFKTNMNYIVLDPVSETKELFSLYSLNYILI